MQSFPRSKHIQKITKQEQWNIIKPDPETENRQPQKPFPCYTFPVSTSSFLSTILTWKYIVKYCLFQFDLNKTTLYIFLWVWLCSRQYLWDLFMLLWAIVDHSFPLLYNILLFKYTMITEWLLILMEMWIVSRRKDE